MSYWEDKRYAVELRLAQVALERQRVGHEMNRLTREMCDLHGEILQINLRLTQSP